MPIIPNIGRRTLKIRAVIVLVYAFLVVGSISMAYPLLIMLSGSVKGSADVDRMDPLPQVFYSDAMRFARFQEERYGTLTALSAAYSTELLKNDEARVPRVDTRALRRFQCFLRERGPGFPDHFYLIQEMTTGQRERVLPRAFRLFREQVRKECGSIDTFNRRYNSVIPTWNDFGGVVDAPLTKEFVYDQGGLTDRYLEFKRSRPFGERTLLNIDGYYVNVAQGFSNVKSGNVTPGRLLPATCPSGSKRAVWVKLVKHHLNCMFVRLDADGLRLFRVWMARKFPGGVEQMNRVNDTAYLSFDAINASFSELRNNAFFTLYTDFVTNVCPSERLRVDTPSTRFRNYAGDPQITMPVVAYDYSVFQATRRSFMTEILTRNYVNVVEYISVYGRAIFNTAVYIGLSILAALVVCPLAAYALSRFNLKSTYTILMFFLATMAFPGAVTMIPNFLLLKQLHLLNSFWALILPGVANGFSIFILKGFFDSIPRELYESAMIDGAGEWTMFWKFTMGLSKPILALITLGAFTTAYTAFMFALIVCPDENMWTLMVWLYQLQQGAHQSVIYAALVLAAIPTLLVFILAQNTIMKGIVIPVEK